SRGTRCPAALRWILFPLQVIRVDVAMSTLCIRYPQRQTLSRPTEPGITGAPRSMKMGTSRSPCLYDAAARDPLPRGQSVTPCDLALHLAAAHQCPSRSITFGMPVKAMCDRQRRQKRPAVDVKYDVVRGCRPCRRQVAQEQRQPGMRARHAEMLL